MRKRLAAFTRSEDPCIVQTLLFGGFLNRWNKWPRAGCTRQTMGDCDVAEHMPSARRSMLTWSLKAPTWTCAGGRDTDLLEDLL